VINFFLYHTFGFMVAAALMSVGLTGITLAILRRRAILDLPNERSSHTVPTPRGGGWGVMLALLPFWIWALWKAGRLDQPAEIVLVGSTVLLMAVSWIDDRRGLGPAIRFATQIVAVGAVMALLPADLSLTAGLLPLPLDRLVAGFVWLWFVNLFNFMDGIDGITGGATAAMGFGLMLVWLKGRAGEPYNIGNASEVSIRDVARLAAALVTPALPVNFKLSADAAYLTDNPNRRCPDLAKAARDLGYAAEIPLGEGLRRTFRSLQIA